jgi:hypothetical protein
MTARGTKRTSRDVFRMHSGAPLGLVWPHAPSPGGSTRPGMKPNGAFEHLQSSRRSARAGAALSARKSQTARRPFSDLLEIGALGSRLKSSGGRGPATGKSGHLTLGNHSPMVFGRPFGVVSAPRKTEITNARCNSGVGNYPRIGFGLPGHASGSPA